MSVTRCDFSSELEDVVDRMVRQVFEKYDEAKKLTTASDFVKHMEDTYKLRLTSVVSG